MTGKDEQEGWHLGTAVRTWEGGHQAPLQKWVCTCPTLTPSAISEMSPTSFLGSDTEEEEGAGRRGRRGDRQEPTASSSRDRCGPGGGSAPRGALALSVSPGWCQSG